MSNTQSPQSVIEAYIEGTRTRNIDLLKEVFHESAVMSGWLGPDLLHGGPEPFYGALEANEVGPNYTAEITAMGQTDKIAQASIQEENLLGLTFENHFHMAQMADGTWRITSKLFRHH